MNTPSKNKAEPYLTDILRQNLHNAILVRDMYMLAKSPSFMALRRDEW